MRNRRNLTISSLTVAFILLVTCFVIAQPVMRNQGDRTNRQQMTPEQIMERMISRVLEELKLTPEETQVIEPMIRQLYQVRNEHRQALREQVQALRTAVNNDDANAMKTALAKIKEMVKTQNEKEKALEKQLIELLTLKQEAQLTLLGVVNDVGSGAMMGGFFGGRQQEQRQPRQNRQMPMRNQ